MKKNNIHHLILIIPLLIINIISLFNMFNAKLISTTYQNVFYKQLIWFIIGYLLIIIIKKMDLNKVFKYIPYIYIFNVILLILVLIFGKVINGAKCWLSIGPLSFQPSELMKITLTFYLVKIYQLKNLKTFKNQIIYLLKIMFLTLIPSILVFLEPDTGSIINYLIILLVVFIFSKLNIWFYLLFFILGISSILVFLYCYFYNTDFLINIIGTSFFYRMDRLINFTNGTSYQLENALINIGAASLFKFNTNKILLYIPEAPTDFMFAFNIGNYGLLSGILVILCYLIIELYIISKNKKIKSRKYKLLVSTFNFILLFQIIYNIFMNIGLLPIMGIPLPFLSYGGTSTIINFIIIGVILNCLNKYTNKVYS